MGRGETPLTDVWQKRLRRAESLERDWPFAAEVLRFFQLATAFQEEAVSRISEWDLEDPTGHKLEALSLFLPPLLELALREGPPDLSRHAEELRGEPREEWLSRLVACRNGTLDARDAGLGFFPMAVLQPYLFFLSGREGRDARPEAADLRFCPFCGSAPIVSVHREDRQADTVRRTLVCSLCSTEWEFPRVLCPRCREERADRLPRFTAAEIPWIQIEACDSCGRYLKTVDLAKNSNAEPVVDELASTPLDVLARERGYEKIAPNLAGL